MGPADFLILLIVAALFLGAARYAWRHRHHTCGGDCSACPYHRHCDKEEKK